MSEREGKESLEAPLDEYTAIKCRIQQYYPVVLLASLAVSVPHPLYPYFFAHDLGMNSTHYGALMGVAQFAHFIAALLYGLLSDRCGRRRLLIWQGVLASSLYLLFGLTLLCFPPHTNFFKATVCAIYICLAAATTTMVLGTSVVFDFCRSSTALVEDRLAKDRSKFVGHIFGVCGISTVIGPVAGQLVQVLVPFGAGNASALMLACLFALLGALVCLICCHESSGEGKAVTSEDDVETIASAEEETSPAPDTPKQPEVVGAPPWFDLNLLFLCQCLKSMSMCSLTVCYALVLEAYLPDHWFYGWRTESTLALIMSSTSVVRVLLQLKYFQPILEVLGGPGPAYLTGSFLLSIGQCGLFWSLKYIPGWLGMTDSGLPAGHWQIIAFAFVHVGLMSIAVTGGLSLIEPAISSLVGMQMNPFPHIQGLAQGMNSASNLLGASIGPLMFGYMLNMRSSVTPLSPDDIMLDTKGFVIPIADSVYDEYQPLDAYVMSNVWEDDRIAFAEAKPSTSHATESQLLLAEARPAVTFYVAAALALIPLAFTRKILRMNKQWKPV